MLAIEAPARANTITFADFRAQVFDVVSRRVPSLPLAAGDDVEEVRSGDFRFDLGNLYRLVRTLPAADREEEIFRWFDENARLARQRGMAIDEALTWAIAKPKLRPKLVPIAITEQTSNLVHRPFMAGLSVAYGVDLGVSDMYVLDSHLAAWGVGADAVHDAAIANLDAISSVPFNVVSVADHRGGYVDIAVGDAYDAARILLPAFRRRLLDALGPILLAGIPSRDVFLVWTQGFAAEAGFIGQIREDVATMPYALTDKVFVLTDDGVRLATPREGAP